MTIFFFTATGNSLKVSKAFITSDCISIAGELRKSPGNYTDDKIGFVFPSYFHGIPRPVLNFIRRSVFNSPYFFTVITCGSTSGATSLQLQNELKKKGIVLNYAVEVTTINNYVPMFDIEKEIYNQSKKNIESILPAAVHDIRASVNRISSFGFPAKFTHKIAQNIYNRMLDKCDKNLYTDEKCNLCGTCALVCPVNNISISDCVNFEHHCESCFACLHNCPQKAIHHKKEKSPARYRNRSITLENIIESNNK